MNRWLIVLLAAAALTTAGCSKQESSTEEAGTAEVEAPVDAGTAEATPTADATPAADTAATPAADPGAAATPAAADPAAAANPAAAAPSGAEKSTPGGTKYVDLAVGSGDEAVPGKSVVVHYTGKLENGTTFDSSVGKSPFEFPLGAQMVIKGWEEGVAGMKVGGKRKLMIPASQGYGSRDMGVIPPNSNLVFEVELLGVK